MSSECEDQMLNMKSRSLNAEHSLPYERALLMCLRESWTPPPPQTSAFLNVVTSLSSQPITAVTVCKTNVLMV